MAYGDKINPNKTFPNEDGQLKNCRSLMEWDFDPMLHINILYIYLLYIYILYICAIYTIYIYSWLDDSPADDSPKTVPQMLG